MKKFKYAIIKSPSQNIQGVDGVEDISVSELFRQHETLVSFLKNIDLKVHGVPPSIDDLNYIRINELCIPTRKCVIFSNVDNKVLNNYRTELVAHFSRFYPLDRMHYINFPATISAKDVLMVNDTYYVSISDYTNIEGAQRFSDILSSYGFRVIIVNNSDAPLKDYLNYIEHNYLLIKEGYSLPEEFKEFNLINVRIEEENGLGCLWVNDTIIIPNGCEELKKELNQINRYVVVGINDSELRKMRATINSLVLAF